MTPVPYRACVTTPLRNVTTLIALTAPLRSFCLYLVQNIVKTPFCA